MNDKENNVVSHSFITTLPRVTAVTPYPNFSDQLLSSIALVIQNQILKDSSSKSITTENAQFEEASIGMSLNQELTSHSNTSEYVTNYDLLMSDVATQDKIMNHAVPSVENIFKFLKYVNEMAKYSFECNIISIIYLYRFLYGASMPLTITNWHGIWISTIILAQKVWEEIPLTTSIFASFLPFVTKKMLRQMEMNTFTFMEYNVKVSSLLYAEYYLKLNKMFLHEFKNTKSNVWPFKIIKARMLENRTNTFGMNSSIKRKNSSIVLTSLQDSNTIPKFKSSNKLFEKPFFVTSYSTACTCTCPSSSV
eukprot:gene6194-8531_t